MELVDHHCHQLVAGSLALDRFERLLGESAFAAPDGCSAADTGLGLAVRAWCAPELDLPVGAGMAEYVERRAELGVEEVHRRLMSGGASTFLVDTGYVPDEVCSLDQMAEWSGGRVAEVARLETLAERVATRSFWDGGTGRTGEGGAVPNRAVAARMVGRAARTYAERLEEEMEKCRGVSGWKSVAAYRCGLGLDWSRPGPARVREAAREWLSAEPDRQGRWRLENPVLIAHGVWAALDSGLPVQFHTGFGDNDVRLAAADPTLLDPLLRATADGRSPIMLLHCWPYHRQAGYLAMVWPHVYMDVGLAIPHVGHRAAAILAEALELAPWHKVLYSSDAFGLAELYYLGVRSWREALTEALRPLADAGFGNEELVRLGSLVGSGNARRVYGLD